MQPAAFTNRIKRLKNKTGISLEVELAKHNLHIAKTLSPSPKKKSSKSKISFDKKSTPPVDIPEPVIKENRYLKVTFTEIKEIGQWLKELKTLEINKNTDIDNEEIVLLIRNMYRKLTGAHPAFLKENLDGQEPESIQTLRGLGEKIHKIIKEKRNKITELKKQEKEETVNLEKQARRTQKRLTRQLDLKHFNGSLADKLFDLIAERNVKLVKIVLDRIWRKKMKNAKEFEAIQLAQKFLRKLESNTL